MIFLNRRRTGKDPHLEWRVRILFAGAALALVGMGMDSPALLGLAVVVLLSGVGLRFLPRKGEPRTLAEGKDGTEGPETPGEDPPDASHGPASA